MDKQSHDVLNHVLRTLCVDSNSDEVEAVLDLVQHLTTKGGHYESLLSYLDYYGTRFHAPKVCEILEKSELIDMESISTIVDLGAGTGWLGTEIALNFDIPNVVAVDKRLWYGISFALDLEDDNDIQTLLKTVLRPGCLIVMCEFLHCLDNPAKLLSAISHYPMVIIEFDTMVVPFRDSYIPQLTKFGAKPISYLEILEIFKSSGIGVPHSELVVPHRIILHPGAQQQEGITQ